MKDLCRAKDRGNAGCLHLEEAVDAIPDPFDSHPLMFAPMLQLLLAIPDPVLWVVGDTWVKVENGVYFVGADEEVDCMRVYELLRDANGDIYPWTEYL